MADKRRRIASASLDGGDQSAAGRAPMAPRARGRVRVCNNVSSCNVLTRVEPLHHVKQAVFLPVKAADGRPANAPPSLWFLR